MVQRNVSSQDIYNHLLKFSDSWPQMESAITGFMANAIVLDYKRKGGVVEVTVDGATQAIRVPVRDAGEPPAASQEPASAPELTPESLDEQKPPAARHEAKAARPKRGRAAAKHDPIKLTIHGVEVNYREHVRGLVSRIVNKFDMALGDTLTDEWIKEISGDA